MVSGHTYTLICDEPVTLRALRGRPGPDRDDPFVASRMYAPAGLIPTRAERELEKEWAAFDAARPRAGAGVGAGAGSDAGSGADR